ncbi:MAG TPA: MFS transporter [Thermoplasmata archaeon]|nr:MFS transporter [Thermoplasmata archaeon]
MVGSGRTRGRGLLSRYGDLFGRPSFRPFLAVGALQFAAPSTVLVILIYAVTMAYPAADRATYAPLALAFLGLSSALPTLLTALFAGAIADRHDRGELMRTINMISILATAAATADFLFAPGARVPVPGPAGFYLPLWLLLTYPCWGAIVVTSTLFRPAFNSSVPKIVDPVDLGRANGVIYSTAAILSAAGTLSVGGLLSVSSATFAFVVPFLLFFATQATLLLVRADLSVPRSGRRRAVLSEAKEGFVYLGRRRELLQITVAALLVNFFSAVALVELGLYVGLWLGLSAGVWYGAIVTASTLGVAVGFVLISRFRFEPSAGRTIIALTACMGLALFALGLVRSIWLALPIMFVYGMMPGMIQTVVLSTIQATVPDAMMGRVFSADEVGSYALVPFGQGTGGLLTLEIGVQGTYLAAGGAIGVFGLVMATGFGALRRLGFHPRSAEPVSADGEAAASS